MERKEVGILLYNNLKKSFVAALLILGTIFIMEPSSLDGLSNKDINNNEVSKDQKELKKELVTVTKVIDGDTVTVAFSNGTKEKVRLLLMDTPESVHPTIGVQPFGIEASDYAKQVLKVGSKVTIEIGNPERDKYNRLLGYLFVDGKNFNQLMIKKGYARVAYVYPPNTKYLDEFKKAEETAKEQKIGIWSIPGYVTDKGFNIPAKDK